MLEVAGSPVLFVESGLSTHKPMHHEHQSGGIARIVSITAALAMLFLPQTCVGQKRYYAGLLGGISTLSADGSAAVATQTAATSSYKPENGPAIDGFAGLHWNNFLSFQIDYLWNRNALALQAVRANATGGGEFYQQEYRSRQHAALANVLLYFRGRSSRVRPFLSVGTGVVHLAVDPLTPGVALGLTPPGTLRATVAAIHVGVGIDLRVRQRWVFRYSFAETASSNPISLQLAPQGTRLLANFRNLFGIVKEF